MANSHTVFTIVYLKDSKINCCVLPNAHGYCIFKLGGVNLACAYVCAQSMKLILAEPKISECLIMHQK